MRRRLIKKRFGRRILTGLLSMTLAACMMPVSLQAAEAEDAVRASAQLSETAPMSTKQIYSGLTITGGVVEQGSDGQIRLTQSTDYTVSGTWNGTIHQDSSSDKKSVLAVTDGVTANVTLDNLSIDSSAAENICAFEVQGKAVITLAGKNTLKSGGNRAGLEVGDNAIAGTIADITIEGRGSLSVYGGEYGAGIGGGNGENGGIIRIKQGIVEVYGGYNGAGIGGGKREGVVSPRIDGDTAVFITKSGDGSYGPPMEFILGEGLCFYGNIGKMSEDTALSIDVTIPAGKELRVDQGRTLTVDGVLTLDGTIEGEGQINVNGELKGTGTVSDSMTLKAALKADMIAEIEVMTYTGAEMRPEPEVFPVQILDFTLEFENDIDYTYEYENNKAAGTASVTVVPEADSDLIGPAVTKTWTIAKAAAPQKIPPVTMSVERYKTVGDVPLLTDWEWDAADRATKLMAGGSVKADAVYGGADKGNYETERVTVTITRTDAEADIDAKENRIDITCSDKVISNKTLNITKGKSYELKAVASLISGKVSWSSSDKKVASVSGSGKVKALKTGTVTVTAKAADGGKASVKFKVVAKEIKVSELGIKAWKTSVIVGQKATLTAEISPVTAAKKEVTWKSSDTKVAKVSDKGVVTTVGVGTVKITAVTKDGSKKKATLTLKVNKPPKTSIKKLQGTAKAARLTWEEVSGVSGYEISMSTKESSGYKVIKKVDKQSATSYTKKELMSGKKYYFRVRTYKKIGKKTYYSSYSQVRAVTVK